MSINFKQLISKMEDIEVNFFYVRTRNTHFSFEQSETLSNIEMSMKNKNVYFKKLHFNENDKSWMKEIAIIVVFQLF